MYGFKPFTERDHESERLYADIICWTGGEDISPSIYKHRRNLRTWPNKGRDERELDLYKLLKDRPKLGICRGAQLINALNGGSMYQHVEGHARGTHEVEDIHGKTHVVSSVHHQMMVPAPNAVLLAWTKQKGRHAWIQDDQTPKLRAKDEIDPEVLWIKEDKALLFQGHPEFGPKRCTDYFFNLVEEYIRPLL